MGIIEASSAYHNPAKLQAIATRKNEIAMEGPAGGRPCMSAPAVLPVRSRFTITSRACACSREGALKYSPAAAVPVSMKIPEPMMAPMPSAVSDQGPSVFFRRWPGASDSEISLSMDLQQKSWRLEVRMLLLDGGSVVVAGCNTRWWSPVKTGVPTLRDFRRVGIPNAECCFYRFAWPRAIFLTLGFFDPRG